MRPLKGVIRHVTGPGKDGDYYISVKTESGNMLRIHTTQPFKAYQNVIINYDFTQNRVKSVTLAKNAKQVISKVAKRK